MFEFLKKKTKSTGRVGLMVQSDQLVLAHVEQRNGAPYVLNCKQIAFESPKQAASLLEDLVKEYDIEGTQCSYVLNPKDYNLHLVEAPNVEPNELRSAVRWKIKDLLDMKIDDAAIDVFQVPEDAYRGREMVYVVASLKSKIKSIAELVIGSGLELAVIDIPELVMKNISTSYIDDDNGVAFMDLRRTGSTMNISREDGLYLTRRINTQLDPDVMQAADWETLKDRLVLEIQRSLDYYESQMGKSQINNIVIAPRQHDAVAMAASLNEMLNGAVSVLDMSDMLKSDVELTTEMQQVFLPVIGATLRGGQRQQEPEENSPDSQEAA
jgi:MSHA biogenesis protein MshI